MKHRLVEILAFICYWTGIDVLFYFLNRKAKRIITFHNVMPEHLLPEGKRIGLTETDIEFKMMIREILKHFTISNDIHDVHTATITFDDGYKNQCDIACRWLIENGHEAIVFIAGKMINNRVPSEALTIDLLLHWTELADNGYYTIPMIQKEPIELTSTNRSQVWQKYIWPTFIKDSESKGAKLMEAVDNAYPLNKALNKCSEEYLRLRMNGITDKDMNYLQDSGAQVGWHTYNHYPLSALSFEEQRKEIIESAPDKMRSTVFSFPYGELASVNADSIRIAQEGGYPCAVSNVYEHNSLTCAHFIPRYMLSHNKYLLHFELSGTKYFILNKRLLPIV